MGGDVETIKERLEIAEVVSGYVKLEKAGASLKGCCPFHNEKTPSFFVSPSRQSYYCFGCGAKGDIFTFVQELEGLSFREALKSLAERAGVELKNQPLKAGERSEKEKIREVLDRAAQFFENQLKDNKSAKEYLHSRGISDEMIRFWHLGYALAEWRSLYSALLAEGYGKEILIKAGLVKSVEAGGGKEPYDVFRDRLIFPLSDSTGQVIAFSGRALNKDTEPKYLNSPDTVLFTKHEVLYGLDKAKEKIRRQNYAVLVEGQIDLVLSHQAGVDNTVASSGTAFTASHLERLKKLSQRIILAFDGDKAGENAAEKAAHLALSLGLEVKIAELPQDSDPADIIQTDPKEWKEILRRSKPAIEHFLDKLVGAEKDRRKLGKLIEQKILPLLTLLQSSMERSHYVSLIAKRTGMKEEIVWDDLRRIKEVKPANFPSSPSLRGLPRDENLSSSTSSKRSRRELVEERLTEVRQWLKELSKGADEEQSLKKEEAELEAHLENEALHEELSQLTVELATAETSNDVGTVHELAKRVQALHKKLNVLETQRKVL